MSRGHKHWKTLELLEQVAKQGARLHQTWGMLQGLRMHGQQAREQGQMTKSKKTPKA